MIAIILLAGSPQRQLFGLAALALVLALALRTHTVGITVAAIDPRPVLVVSQSQSQPRRQDVLVVRNTLYIGAKISLI